MKTVTAMPMLCKPLMPTLSKSACKNRPPTSPTVLATPPFFPISSDCFAATEDLSSTCGGIGPYTIITWEPDAIRLQANPNWPGSTPPAFENIKVRFYDTVADLRVSLEEFGSVDVAWTGLPYSDFITLQNSGGYQSWTGPSAFKSYLIFEQSQPPWDKRSLREAAALSLDREALADIVFEGERKPLYSPVPDEVPDHIAAAARTRRGACSILAARRRLLRAETVGDYAVVFE